MFQVLLVFTIAIGVGLGAGPGNSPMHVQGGMNENMSLLDGTSNGAPTTDNTDENASLLDGTDTEAAQSTSGWQPEPQIPTGKFTTATEVKPILSATKPKWVAVREYEGKDLLYFTNLLAWRCGLHQVSYSVNGGPLLPLEFEECHLETGQPNGFTMETIMPFLTFEAGLIDSLTVTIVYDDGTTDTATYKRSDILML